MTLTRRDFSRLAGLATASAFVPSAHGQTGQHPIGWCVVGLGRISMDHFMPGVKLSQKGKIVALVSGHRDKAEKQATLYGVSQSAIYNYDNMDAIRDNKEIDAVYIALPNSMHAEYTIRSAKAGKHVLCEKPMATSVADAKAMIEASKAANRKLMIAYRCQFDPLHIKAIEMIRSGQLGQIQGIESAFGFNIQPGEWRLDRKLAGGGPLMDVGIYCLNASRYLTGEEPQEIKAYSSVIDHDGRFNTVEENVSWTMKFPSGIVAACNTTYGGNMNGYFRVHGAKGAIEMLPAFNYDGMHLAGQIGRDQKIDELSPVREPMEFTRQADHFADCVWNDRTPKTPGEEGLRDMELMSEIYQAAGLPGL
ncbi:MAG: Gfo/Idh/MocA family oxidoreductase [Silvibacterium sp.]|nr:Gfo/Idh/MocA family oxidoreductase [Silvibacterium sp.]MBV8438769.1 Gfo/Idh/MocA family oxidoreductase [Silvibacterium sp.]